MRVTRVFVGEMAEKTNSKGGIEGRVLDPIPSAQTQEGPTCGFYALSIVMDYWKAKGRTKMSAPARQRDIDLQNRDPAEKDNPSLRNLGKQVGALDVNGVVKVSTGGVWTAKQLAAVAGAVKFANFNVRVETVLAPYKFIPAICQAIDAGIPPIVAFDVDKHEAVSNAAGQKSHWGVIIGYFVAKGATWFIATHGHGGYYVWPAIDLQKSNFALADTTYKKQLEKKIQVTGTGLTQTLTRYARTQWAGPKRIEEISSKIAEDKLDATLSEKGDSRDAFEVAQDLGRHIVLVEPAN